MLIIVLLFLLGFILITKGADIFINYTVIIGKKTNISELILGATIVSFATTLPELTVSLFASIDGHTTMSLGNAIGSIICNTGLVLGLVSFISPFKVDKNMFMSRSIILLVSIIMLIVLGIDGNIDKRDGFILLIVLAIYMYTNYKGVSNENKKNKMISNSKERTSLFEGLKIIIFFIVGLVMMVIGSKLLVDNGVEIAKFIGIPQGVISLTVIALGTSLPELVSSITAIRKNHHAISVGNVLGANILNIVSVVSISSIPNTIPILSQTIKVDLPFMILLLLVLILPTLKNNKLYRYQGLSLLVIYFTYIITLYSMYIG